MSWKELIGLGLCTVGGMVSCLNFYLSFLRYPLHCYRGGTRANYRFVSGIPVFGSLLLWVGAGMLRDRPGLAWAAVLISLFDTAGLHWFAGVVLYMSVFRRGRDTRREHPPGDREQFEADLKVRADERIQS